DTRQSPNYFRAFYARRALRIFPLYYLFLGTYIALYPWVGNASADASVLHDRAWWHFAYLSNWFRASLLPGRDLPGFGHLWSLSIEEQFYLVWPAVVLLLKPHRLRQLCVGLIVAAPFLRLALLIGGVHPG